MNNKVHQLQATSPLSEWLSYLENAHVKTIDLGLERVKSVAEQLDLLHPAPFIITVGGTNGKGTTCRLLEMILLEANLRVGVYSSPHLLHYAERVRIQNQQLADELHCQSFDFINKNKTHSLTYFEFSTLSALYLFKQAKLDVVILEVGLGGRLDATNIVDNDIAVITSIDIDHTDFLGDDRETIGFEKAGIFRQHKMAIIGEPNIPNSIFEQGKIQNCQLICRDIEWTFKQVNETWCWQQGKVRLENLPIPQIPLANAATALAVVQQLPFSIFKSQIVRALQQVELTGRFQKIKLTQLSNIAKKLNIAVENLPSIIIDVGHNPHAARYLAEKLTALKIQTRGKIFAICGILKDKDAKGILSPLLSIIDDWYCIGLQGSRGQSGNDLLNLLKQVAESENHFLSAQSDDNIFSVFQTVVNNSHKNDIILVFGSFYTVSDFLQLL
ncbi:bifunctional tetrahydrofolate synthase/dihydrofolate synthase [Seminibacterium arietis]|uniref:Dihydrofolate synthase/folylpolyglutamate synthase n=1 Tax=Seminibacterium arietis TaxID=1173502 RepID=A0ABW3I7G7_9PAST